MIEAVLDVSFGVAFAVAAVFGLAYFWRWYYDAGTDQNETHYFRTPDGWRLAVHRYRSDRDSKGMPVILCHGLSANRYVFDMPAGPSLARYLRAHGRDVWVVELRGSGMSERPGPLLANVPLSWTFEDHLLLDLPATINEVLRCTGAPRVHWVGHSMGGMLMLAHLACGDRDEVVSAVAMASPTDFSKLPEDVESLAECEWVFRPFSVFPLTVLAKLLVPIAHCIPPWLMRMFHGKNMEPCAARSTLALAAEIIAPSSLWLDFGRFVRAGWCSASDGRRYVDGLARSRVPLFIAGGSMDRLVGAEAVAAACKPGPDPAAGERECLIFGKASGHHEDYGHVDLLVGMRAETEVFPELLRWLEQHDTKEFRGPDL